MFNFTASYSRSSTIPSALGSKLVFGTDEGQDSVFLSGRVIDSVAFSQMMLTLGNVVRLQDATLVRDHSVYQSWVAGEYLKALPQVILDSQRELAVLLPERDKAAQEVAAKQSKITALETGLTAQRRKYYDWLYQNNREQWFVLDPIVSVQADSTYFEAFSQDESVYARVSLPHSQIESPESPRLGTTNIDFSVALERELSRSRSYRSLDLTVGQAAVTLATDSSSLVEKKIDLPDSWVRGLVEVQAAEAMIRYSLDISPLLLLAVISRLESRREKRGPRALRIVAVPGEKIVAVLEPWNITLPLSDEPFSGRSSLDLRVWGRRRLRVLKDLLIDAEKVTLNLIDDGMPSFWTVSRGDISITVGLSGWTSQDWASKVRFSSLAPTETLSESEIAVAVQNMQKMQLATKETFADSTGFSAKKSAAALHNLCRQGMAMYDSTRGIYTYRRLFPQLQLPMNWESSTEERQGVKLYEAGMVTVTSSVPLTDHVEFRASVITDDGVSPVILTKDSDLRATYAQCDCTFFRHNQLRLGPCRHIIATSLTVDNHDN